MFSTLKSSSMLKSWSRDECCSLAYAPEPLLTLGLVFLRYQQKCRRKAKREIGQQLSSLAFDLELGKKKRGGKEKLKCQTKKGYQINSN